MVRKQKRGRLLGFCAASVFLASLLAAANPPLAINPPPRRLSPRQDDSVILRPPPDLTLSAEGTRKVDALSASLEGARLEENGEIEEALGAYRRVLNVDPGQAELATRVAALLSRQNAVPEAIDVLKDAIKANPKSATPYHQLAFIYAKYLRRYDQAVKYANEAIAIDPKNVDGYQRLSEVYAEAGDARKALGVLERAERVESSDAVFWTRLGKLYAAIVTRPDAAPSPEEMRHLNALFQKAAEHADDNPAVLKEIADFYASSQQVQQAIPLYLRILEVQPDDAQAREKLATGFLATHQRDKAIEMLEQIIKQHPDKYQAYELLAQLYDEEGRALARANQNDAAKAQFAKAAASYEQCVLINPARANNFLRLAELWVGALQQGERAIKLLGDARHRFPDAAEFTYLLALAQREAKHAPEAVIAFEEAVQEAEATGAEFVNARFYLEYGAAAEQAKLFDKAAELFRQSIAMDPANSAEACNYLGYMWAEQNMHLDEAAEMIGRALKADPNSGAYLDSLGWLDYRRGHYEDALNELLRAARQIAHDDPVVFEHLGDTYAKLNRIPQALEFWQKGLALDPANKALAQKIESTKTQMTKGESARPNPIK